MGNSSTSKPSGPKTALIFGVTGQDGAFLSELLLGKGYEVVGVSRRSSVDTTERLKKIKENNKFSLVEGDVIDAHNVNWLIHTHQPSECYNLAAQSHVGTSFKQPMLTWKVNAEGVMNILEAIRCYHPATRFYQASTSEMFGSNYSTKNTWKNEVEYLAMKEEERTMNYQNENTPFAPCSPYAVAKLAAHNMVDVYRNSYGIHASCGILFNHESELRGEQFVTRKITKWIGEFDSWRNSIQGAPIGYEFKAEHIVNPYDDKIKFPKLRLGNIDARRDWGHAKDYVEAMWLMLQQDKPDDYVVATGETHSIRQFLDVAFKIIGINNWEDYIYIDPKFYRPNDVEFLLGLPDKAERVLGWKRKIDFENLVEIMVQHDSKKTKWMALSK